MLNLKIKNVSLYLDYIFSNKMTFKMPELRIVSTNLCPQTTSLQKDDYPPNKGRVPAAFHLLPYYARRNELNILRELHAKLSDPQKKLHQKMMMDAILREQLAVRYVF